MRELLDNSLEMEEKLRDLEAHQVETSLAAARMLLEEDDTADHRLALVACLVMAQAVIAQLGERKAPVAIDGDIHFRHHSWAPGRSISDLVEQLRRAEIEAVTQRKKQLLPLVRSALRLAQQDTVNDLLGLE